MSEASRSDTDEFAAAVVERYLPRVRLFATRWLRDAAEADDAAQETLRRVIDALRDARIRDLQALPAFIFETARHVCQHAIRHRHRTAHAHAGYQATAASISTSSADPLAALITAERCSAVRRALLNLDPVDREMIRLSYVEGATADHIAQQLGLTPGNVRVRRHRILRKLAAMLAVTPGDPREPKD
jgi:RNA polymerase sigma-70 factor (ECF subfamily)